ncbi:hypothetical protein MTR67_047777 [Solanum verrucosum]|uniref:Uncharacterized protein n=1 Tax=Solanum verrucosum TaxID=315347 RepID=A0AAF0ZVX0_SOLVR|nr:hypothetical protein MTR67_047777 [Solanum verrucosum]
MIPWRRISGQPVTEPDEVAKFFRCPLPSQKLKPESCCHDKDERIVSSNLYFTGELITFLGVKRYFLNSLLVLDSRHELTLWARAVSQSEVWLYAHLIDCHLLNVRDVDRTHDCMLPRDLTIFCRVLFDMFSVFLMICSSVCQLICDCKCGDKCL